MDKDKEIALAIGKIINGYGGEMLSPYSRIKGLLMDLLPKYSKERRLIMIALSCGVGVVLYNNKDKNGRVNTKAKNSSKRFLLEAYVSEEAAEMVIEWIVASFSVRESLPKPKQYEYIYAPVKQDFELHDAENSSKKHLPTDTVEKRETDAVLRMREIASRFLSPSSKSNIIQGEDRTKIKFDATGHIFLQGDLRTDSYVFEDGVTSIAEKAFANASHLQSVTFTNSIIYVGKEAFANCTSLTNVVLLRNMKNLGEGIFKGCSALDSIILPSNMETIPGAMFKRCSNLININIPRTLQKIGDEAFRECAALEEINLPDTLASISIGDRAFWGCSSLHTIRIGQNVKQIGRDAFLGCAPDFCIDVVNNMYVIKYCVVHHIKFNRK